MNTLEMIIELSKKEKSTNEERGNKKKGGNLVTFSDNSLESNNNFGYHPGYQVVTKELFSGNQEVDIASQQPFRPEETKPIQPLSPGKPQDIDARLALNELKQIQKVAGVSLKYDNEGRAFMRFNPPLNQRDEDMLDKAEYAYMLFEMCFHLLDKSKNK